MARGHFKQCQIEEDKQIDVERDPEEWSFHVDQDSGDALGHNMMNRGEKCGKDSV